MAARTTESSVVSNLEERIAALEKSSWNANNSDDDADANANADDAATIIIITPELRRARRAVQTSQCCYSSIWKHCPPEYYSLKLEERRVILGADSVSQLCKACLFENRNFKLQPHNNLANDDVDVDVDPTNSRYYLIVVQYVESINTRALGSELRGLRPPGRARFDPGYFSDLRLAPEDVSERLTGYGHNGVSPFGMPLALAAGSSSSSSSTGDRRRSVPVIVCKSILDVRPQFIWMGGGHRDWKLGMAVSEFVRGVDGIVLDVSEKRTVV